MLVAIGIMYSQFIHPMLRASMSALDIMSFVWGAVCQQVIFSPFLSHPKKYSLKWIVYREYNVYQTGHTFGNTNHLRPIHNADYISGNACHIHIIFGQYRCIAAEPEPFDTDHWRFAKFTIENVSSRSRIQSLQLSGGKYLNTESSVRSENQTNGQRWLG